MYILNKEVLQKLQKLEQWPCPVEIASKRKYSFEELFQLTICCSGSNAVINISVFLIILIYLFLVQQLWHVGLVAPQLKIYYSYLFIFGSVVELALNHISSMLKYGRKWMSTSLFFSHGWDLLGRTSPRDDKYFKNHYGIPYSTILSTGPIYPRYS